jgi:uncharacterized protein (DUF849 family)
MWQARRGARREPLRCRRVVPSRSVMLNKVIITCAVTGSTMDALRTNSAVPVTPRQIAEEAIQACAAGAAIAHIHVRDPISGEPSMELALYEEVVQRIRDSGSPVLINLTTGPGARFAPSDENPMVASPESTMSRPERRVEHVLKLRPELCSLDIATMTFPGYAFVNLPAHLERMAALVQDAGVKPELEVFDLGHVRLASHFVERGIIKGRPLFQLCLGIPWTAPASPDGMLAMARELPPEAQWAAFGISSQEFPMVAQAVLLGGNVRVGLEDNIYLRRGVLASGNAALVERAVTIIESLGTQVATPAEARVILGLSTDPFMVGP